MDYHTIDLLASHGGIATDSDDPIPSGAEVHCRVTSPLADKLENHLRRQGMTMRRAQLSESRGARLFVLPVHGPEESGWLRCAKLTALNSRISNPVRVVLIAPEVRPGMTSFAKRVGAVAVLPESASPRAITEALLGTPAPLIG